MSSKKSLKKQALEYHAKGRPGKIEVIPTKEYANQKDLSLAYSPGVAEPCMAIHENPEDAYKYTAKGNLVAVISNGTAVLGLGNIGAMAGKPVMEGKGLLFKIFADIDVFDIELDTEDVDEFVRTVKILEPTFGGVNLEDISAPSCFEIEERLKKELNIPVMHDDQHGTAIISAAALLNAVEIVEKDISKVRIIVNGAGASAISCAGLYIACGASKENVFMFDSKGLLHPARDNMNDKKQLFANDKLPMETTLEDAMKGADVFVGLSRGNVVSKDMAKSMAKDAIIFALANPDPEITYEDAMAARDDLIMATGRSDYPNQVNNVLGFPYIFRGALDVRSSQINEEMKLAAVYALADLAKKPVPDLVNLAYSEANLTFGRDYIIPKPVDPRLITTVAPAVAKAAMESGVARKKITNWEEYNNQLSKRLGQDTTLSRVILNKARQNPKRVVYADAENANVLKAVQQVLEDKIATPILLGNIEKINALAELNNIKLDDIEIIDPRRPKNKTEEDRMTEFADYFFKKRQRKGITYSEAKDTVKHKNYYGSMMVEMGHADTMIGGMTRNYPDTVKPAIQVVGTADGVDKVFGMYVLMSRFGPLFLADTTVNFDPTEEELVQIAEITSDFVKQLNMHPRIAFVTYSNFGSVPKGPAPMRLRKAVDILRKKHPEMIVDGEIQAHLAFDTELMKESHPFSSLADGPANVLIFPNLSSANIAYNLLAEVAGIEKIGPLLFGLKKPIQILQLGATVREIVNLTAITVMVS